jgi:NADH-quinone oxidoreductase subunit J
MSFDAFELGLFYFFAALCLGSAVVVVGQRNPLYSAFGLIVTLCSLSAIFGLLGSPFIAALQVIVYAGAIMVLFVFVVMMLNLGPASVAQERGWLKPGIWAGPVILGTLLLLELLYVLFVTPSGAGISGTTVGPKEVGISLFGPYLLVVELASMLLLAAAVTAFHLGRNEAKE